MKKLRLERVGNTISAAQAVAYKRDICNLLPERYHGVEKLLVKSRTQPIYTGDDMILRVFTQFVFDRSWMRTVPTYDIVVISSYRHDESTMFKFESEMKNIRIKRVLEEVSRFAVYCK